VTAATPLVAVLCRVPLVVEGLRDALEEIGDVACFSTGNGESGALLESLRPDAVVVDGDREAASALEFSRSTGAAALYVRLDERRLELAAADGWVAQDVELSPECVRNLLARALFGRQS
jgi:DNA-binding NarL/FixJ family response regulator